MPREKIGDAILFMDGGLYTMDAFGALNSSPWTAESFGGDPVKARLCRAYVGQAMTVSSVYAGIGAIIAGNWWPLVGSAINNLYLWYMYNGALKRAVATGSKGWSN
jgi:hypothetical protein